MAIDESTVGPGVGEASPGRSATPLDSVVRAKLRPAVNPEYLVRRPRLHDLLDAAVRAPLTLVVAPAGSGKTSVLRSWVAETAMPHAWLSLDETDRDPVQLWLGILAALETIAPGCGSSAMDLVRRPGSLNQAVGSLLDDLEARDVSPRVLVVDDLQLVDEVDAVAATLALFVQHLPPWLHVVVASRHSPRLPVHRLRARGQLGEVRFAELRFSLDEAAEMLHRIAPELPPDRIAEVAARAGGWAASIQLAALAARSNRAQVVVDVPGQDHATGYLEDYVWHEVLANERADVLDVLLATSVLDRIDPRLAEVLADRPDAAQLLTLAEERGLFVTRVEPYGSFQVHALVREVLVAVIARRSPDRLRDLHTRAAAWFESERDVVSALEHLVRAERHRQALHLLATEASALYDAGRESTILRTIAAIPVGVASQDAPAMIEYAWCHVLVDRQRFLLSVDHVSAWTADEAVDTTSASRVQMLRSMAATIRGDWAQGALWADDALRGLGTDWLGDSLGRFGWNMIARDVALGERWDDAGSEVRAAMRALSIAPERRIGFEGTRALGTVLAGHPVDALRVVAGARTAADFNNMTILRTELAIAEAMALREIGDSTAARPALAELAAGRVEPIPYACLLACLQLVETRIDDVDLVAAEEAFGQATELVDTEMSGPGARDWVARAGVQLALAAGEESEARGWAAQISDPFWSAVCSGKVLLVADESAAAADVLKTAEPRCLRHHVVRELLLSQSVKDPVQAEAHLLVAVQLAAPQGLVQTVASEGAPLVEAVERLAWRAPQAWLDHLRRAAVPGATGGVSPTVKLVESLTDRELEVLRLLPSRLTLREIADELFISMNTLKFHLKVIYRKLDCGSRGEAAQMARALTSLHHGAQSSSARRR